ncbi:hypothetical protein EsH8_VII_000993 [Colletotrichum jinshuiense]
MSNSDSKSRFTTFSAPPGSVIDSLSLTTPSQSRAQSPVPPLLPLPSAMEADLVGIGYQSKPSITETFRTSLPIQCRSARELDLPFSTDRSKTPRQVDVTNDSNIILDIPTVREGFSDCSNSDDEDFNLDLERTADIALSQCFGVALSRLTRPIRVVQAFSGFREQCAEILQDEEQYTSIYWDDDSLSCYDGEESPQGSREQCFGKASTQTELSKSKTNKRCNDQEKREDGDEIDKSDDESNPDSGFKKRRRYKRRRVSNDYSCLFRKRNPKRFNVRAHEACANVSYPNIHKLKLHLRAHHFKPACPRCGKRFAKLPDPFSSEHTDQDCRVRLQAAAHLQRHNPEDGFDQTIEKRLTSRKNDLKIDDWDSLWRTLFPEDDTIPPRDFEPVIEHHDVADDGCNDFVKDSARDVIKLICQDFKLVDESAFTAPMRRMLSETIHQHVEVLLKNSQYAILRTEDRAKESPPSSILGQSSSQEHDFVDISTERNEGEPLSDGDLSPTTVITPKCTSSDNEIEEFEIDLPLEEDFSLNQGPLTKVQEQQQDDLLEKIQERMQPIEVPHEGPTAPALDGQEAFEYPIISQSEYPSNFTDSSQQLNQWLSQFQYEPITNAEVDGYLSGFDMLLPDQVVGSESYDFTMPSDDFGVP